ncbi:MAG: tetratricopeptide repeat protein [Thermoplasmata archaeon]
MRKDLEGVKLENERVKIADRVLETLLNIAEERAVALVLEDLHWADESSLFILDYLARNAPSGKLVVVCSARTEDGPWKIAIERIVAEGAIRILELRKLEANNMSRLVSQLYNNNQFPDSFIHNLASKCAGNPFFMIELLRQMEREGNIVNREGRHWLINEDFIIPNSVETVVQRRLDTLEPDALALAEYASCIGKEFGVEMAMTLATLKDSKYAYASLLESGIVNARNGRAEFSHALFQEIIYGDIGDNWRVMHHRSLGEHLERTYAQDQESVLYDLARHFSRANVPEKAHEYCIRAGEKAEGAFATEMAVKFYRDGLMAADKLQGQKNLTAGKLDILEKLGDLHSFLGEYPSALEKYADAQVLCEGMDTRIRLCRKKADTLDSTGEYESALAMIQEGKDRSADSVNVEIGRLILSEARILQNRGDFEEGIALCNEAIAIFRGCDSNVDIGNTMRLLGDMNHKMGRFSEALALYVEGLGYFDPRDHEKEYVQSEISIGVLHADRGEYGKALEYLLRSKEALERKNDKKALANIQNSIGAVYWLLGENEKARDNFFMTLAKLERMGQKRGIALLLNNIGATYMASGELAKTLEYYKRSLDIRRKIGDKSGIVQSLSNLGGLLFDMGSLDEALADLKECEETAREINDEFTLATCLLNIADIRTFMGEHNAAFKLLDESLELFKKVGDLTTIVNVYACFSNCYLGIGENAKALENAQLALDSATALEVETKSQIALGRLALGRAKSATGDTKSARNELDKAIVIWAQIQDVGMQAKAMLDKGIVLQVEGDIGNAKAVISDAQERFEKVGMILWAEKCRKALGEL